jgi:prophage DNA circulation protein
MSWRDNLRDASFRGVPFKIRSHTYGVGRRNIVHEYPYSDDPYAEDLGGFADDFSIEAYIIQTSDNNYDYFAERDALINALKQKGPGKLVHPFLGDQMVVPVGRQSVTENFDSGGWARFTLSFSLAGDNIFPLEDIDPVGLVDTAAENAINASIDSFYDQYNNSDQAGWVVQSAIDDFADFVSSMKSAVNRIRSTSGSSLEQIKSAFDDARSTMLEAAAYPCQVAGLVGDVFDSVLGLANLVGSGYLGEIAGNCSGQVYFNKLDPNGDQVSRQMGESMTDSLVLVAGNSDNNGFGVSPSNYQSSIGGALDEISVTTATRARQAANRLAMVNMIRAQALIAATRAAIRIEYDSLQDMQTMQNKIIDSLDYLLLRIGDESSSDPYKDYGIYVDHHSLYGAMEDIRADFISAMRQKGLSLSVEIDYEAPPDGITSLQLAYSQYNDLDQENDVYMRNIITNKHPGFMLGDLKLLNQ